VSTVVTVTMITSDKPNTTNAPMGEGYAGFGQSHTWFVV
jgi:hypothetical protein